MIWLIVTSFTAVPGPTNWLERAIAVQFRFILTGAAGAIRNKNPRCA